VQVKDCGQNFGVRKHLPQASKEVHQGRVLTVRQETGRTPLKAVEMYSHREVEMPLPAEAVKGREIFVRERA
jgi:hypothetical protein